MTTRPFDRALAVAIAAVLRAAQSTQADYVLVPPSATTGGAS